MTDFKNIEYLKNGNKRQRISYFALHELAIFDYLKKYNPILTGTIPIEIDLPDSDLDIICECKDHISFAKDLTEKFGKYFDFHIWSNTHHGIKSTIASFSYKGQKIEIFGQNIPTDNQNSFRHMLIERQILQEKGTEFKNKIVELKKQGIKTEPAFAQMLGLKGNPYLELLKFDTVLKIREIETTELPFLEEMLYQAIFVADENIVLPREIIEQPDLKKYIQDFGQDGDYCLVAEQNKKLIGAIWIRYINGYGFVDKDTPELSMAVFKGHRGKGIGEQLLMEMIDRLKDIQIKQISLSVDKDNFAHGFYKKHGFVDYLASEKSIIMTKELIET